MGYVLDKSQRLKLMNYMVSGRPEKEAFEAGTGKRSKKYPAVLNFICQSLCNSVHTRIRV
jgi:hypothetical protein